MITEKELKRALRCDIDIKIKQGTLFSHWVISRAVDLGFQFGLYG
jgi:hypothetical protein